MSFDNSGEQIAVLGGLSFEVGRGEFVSIVGPSGCGKTTLLNCVAGLAPDSCRISGHILFSDGNGERTPSAYVFQTPRLLNWLTIEKNVNLPLLDGRLGKSESARVVAENLARFEIADIKKKYPLFCSEGEKSRAALARAFVTDAELILMDEPFGNLDSLTAGKIRDRLARIFEDTEKTALFVTHNLREAVCLSHRVIVLSRKPARIKGQVEVDLPKKRLSLNAVEFLPYEEALTRLVEEA